MGIRKQWREMRPEFQRIIVWIGVVTFVLGFVSGFAADSFRQWLLTFTGGILSGVVAAFFVSLIDLQAEKAIRAEVAELRRLLAEDDEE